MHSSPKAVSVHKNYQEYSIIIWNDMSKKSSKFNPGVNHFAVPRQITMRKTVFTAAQEEDRSNAYDQDGPR